MFKVIRRLVKAFWAWRLRHNKRFMAGVRRGLEAYRRGDLKPWSEVKKELGLGEEKPKRRRPTRFEVTLAMGEALTDFIFHPRDDEPAPLLAVKKELKESVLLHLNNLGTVNKDGIAIFDNEHGLHIRMD